MEKEVIYSEENKQLSPAQAIENAVKAGANLADLEKLLSLQERWEAKEAKKAFSRDFAKAQEKILSVTKKHTNQQTHSKYADLGDVIESSKPVYTKEGFSVIFYEGETKLPDHIRVCADVLHSMGHKETYHFDVPLDGEGIRGNANMTKIHGRASSTSYGRRYLMCMIWNIPTSDNDAQKPVALISEKEKSNLIDLLASKNLPEAGLLKFMKVNKLEEIKAVDYNKAIASINATANKKATEKK